MRRHSNSTVFNLLILCLGIFLSADYFQPTVLASPIAEVNSLELRDLVKRYSGTPSGKLGNGGPADSDYPSDDEINQAYTAPSGPFVFYSGIGSSEEPYEFAKSLDNGAVILRGAFTKGYITQGSPKKSKEWFQDFLDRVSGFYADKAIEAGNTVYFVGRFDASVAACSVWSRIELPTLTAGGIKITLVDYSNFDNKKDYPLDLPNSPIDYPGIPPREVHGGLVRRQDYCFDWQGDHEDPADPDSDPQIGLDYYPGNCGVHLQQVSSSLPFLFPLTIDSHLPVSEERRPGDVKRERCHLPLPLHYSTQGRPAGGHGRSRLL